MNFKPSDFLITIFEFFSVMLPGAVLCYFLGTQYGDLVFGQSRLFATPGSTEKWVVFIFSSYLLGHILFAIGSRIDRYYDNNKSIKKKRNEKYDLSYLTAHYIQEGILKRLMSEVLKNDYTKDKFSERGYWQLYENKRLANEVEKDSIKNANDLFNKKSTSKEYIENKTDFIRSQEILNTYKFVKATMLLYFPAASAELTYMEASQKFFRTLFVAFVIIGFLLLSHFLIPYNRGFLKIDFGVGFLVSSILAWVCFVRYCDQRFKSTQIAYELLITFDKVGKKMRDQKAT